MFHKITHLTDSEIRKVLDRSLHGNREFQAPFWSTIYLLLKLKNKSGVDESIVKKQPYQLLSTNREFFPSFDTSNIHKLDDESS